MKKEFKYFSIFNHESEEEYLRSQHQHGWEFVKVTGIGMYHFQECEPEDVIYQLDYNQDGLRHKEEYLKMFEDCGWEYMQDFFGYSYFRKAVTEDGIEEEIFCDEESRFQMMQRVIKGRMLPMLILFFLVLMPQFMSNLFYTHNYLAVALIGGVLAMYFVVFGTCFVKYNQYKNNKKK